MIELGEGCRHMTCTCGHEFCYSCGKAWWQEKGSKQRACELAGRFCKGWRGCAWGHGSRC